MDNGVVVIGTDSVNIYWRGAGYPNRMYIYNVDLTNKTRLTVTAKCGRNTTDFRIEKIGSATLSRVLFTGNSIRTVDIDVSSYTGLNTLEFSLNNYDTGYIYNMVMS